VSVPRPHLVARLRAPSDAGYLSLCRLALAGAVQNMALADEALDELKLVLSELCAAAIRHGASEIELEFRTSATEVEITVGGAPAGPTVIALLDALTTRWSNRADGLPGITFARRIAP